MALAPGSKFGVYEVTAKIGSGGMGEVYRAHDTTLNRDVALKVLPDAFANDPERLARFEREAKVLASLNHPNIAAIYGLERSADTRALILELVEGPTLQDRIAQGPIPLDEALPIARQIAEAPEQARGKTVNRRADIWAFGAVVYEMLTGKRAFPGEAMADSVARIIERNPDYDTLPPDVPPSIRQLVRRCLEKDQRERLRDIGDARIEIKQALATPPHDAYRKIYEPPGSGANAVPVLEEQENRRRKAIEDYKVGGLITVAAGIGIGPFLYFVAPDTSVWVAGLIPLMIGLALLLYGFVLAPRSAPGREHR